MEPEIRHERIAGDGVSLHVAVAGDGPPLVLLHGFPENWQTWRRQFAPLVHAGFSVWAPDLRGYNLSDRPASRRAYAIDHLVADVAAVVRATGRPRAHVGGHDWGGVIAWVFASAYRDLIDTLLIFNAPHPAIYAERVWRPPQLLRSWYVLFFLLPRVSERALSAFDFHAVRRIFRTASGRRPAFDDEEIEEYVRALAQPGALTAALNYYRANVASPEGAAMQATPIDVETLVLWGERDPALTLGLLDGLDRIVTRLHVHRIPDAGHWVQNEAPDEVNDTVIAFLRSERVR